MRPSDVLTPVGLGSSLRSPFLESGALSPAALLNPGGILAQDVAEPLAIPIVGGEESKSPDFQRSKALFFFKLERELEKVRLT